jgi:hypothetical protein
MNADNEYYTPIENELHIGFECEIQYDAPKDHWYKASLVPYEEYSPNKPSIIAAAERLSKGHLRVKRLCHEDIIECGWEKVLSDNENHAGVYTKNKEDCKHVLQCYFGSNREIKNVKITVSVPKGYEIVFFGTIANISELRRIMKQVGI